MLSPYPPVRITAAAVALGIVGLALLSPHAGSSAEPTVADFHAVVARAIKDGHLFVLPYDFKDGVIFLEGGVRRIGMEENRATPDRIVVDTLALVEAKKNGLTEKERKKLEDGYREKMLGIVKDQLDLIANHKGKPEELLEKLRALHDKARDVFAEAARSLGYRPRAEGDRRWLVTFAPDPDKGATVEVINAGDYDVYLWRKKMGRARDEPDWVPLAERSEHFGDKCFYKVRARWEDGATSAVEDLRVTGDRKVVLKKKR